MIKVKADFIQKVIVLGVVHTRDFMYYCPGKADFKELDPMPIAYPVARMKNNGFVEAIGLYDSEGRKI